MKALQTLTLTAALIVGIAAPAMAAGAHEEVRRGLLEMQERGRQADAVLEQEAKVEREKRAKEFESLQEAQRVNDELARQIAEQERQEAAKPSNKLFEAYWRFALVQYCHKVRQGYAMIFISDPEFERAQTVAKAIEKQVIAVDATLNTDAIWRESLGHAGKQSVSVDWCQRAYSELLNMSPIGVFHMEKP